MGMGLQTAPSPFIPPCTHDTHTTSFDFRLPKSNRILKISRDIFGMKIKTILVAFGQTSFDSLLQCSADGGAGDHSVTTLQLGKAVSFARI